MDPEVQQCPCTRYKIFGIPQEIISGSLVLTRRYDRF